MGGGESGSRSSLVFDAVKHDFHILCATSNLKNTTFSVNNSVFTAIL
jgi:hypothetical protein